MSLRFHGQQPYRRHNISFAMPRAATQYSRLKMPRLPPRYVADIA